MGAVPGPARRTFAAAGASTARRSGSDPPRGRAWALLASTPASPAGRSAGRQGFSPRCCRIRHGSTGCEDELAEIQFHDPKLDQLRQEIVGWFTEAPNLDAATLQRHLLRYGFGPVLDQFAADLTQPRLPAPDPDEQARRQSWRDMLIAIRQRAAIRRERPTEDDLRREDGVEVNRWFYRLDRLLNRSGADDGEPSDGSSGVAG